MPTDSVSWTALALALTLVGAVLTWVAWQRRGPVAGLRGVAWTLIPIAAWLTGTLKLAGEIGDDVSSWAAHLVFSPVVWLGISVAGLSAGLFFVTAALRARQLGAARPTKQRSVDTTPGSPKQVGSRQPKGKTPKNTSEEDEIEAILRKHGIS